MKCWTEECAGHLLVPSGVLALQDPATGSDVELQVGANATVKFTYLYSERDVAGLELVLLPRATCQEFRLLGQVGVDSAQILIADRHVVESYPEQTVFLKAGKDQLPVIKKVINHFRLRTVKLAEECLEVLADDCQKLIDEISEFIRSKLRLNPEDYVHLEEGDVRWERCCQVAWTGGLFSFGESLAFLCNTGGDGRFQVIGGYERDRLVKIWVQIQTGLYVDGKVSYSPQPAHTRPQPKPLSPEMIALLFPGLQVNKPKRWWKFW